MKSVNAFLKVLLSSDDIESMKPKYSVLFSFDVEIIDFSICKYVNEKGEESKDYRVSFLTLRLRSYKRSVFSLYKSENRFFVNFFWFEYEKDKAKA